MKKGWLPWILLVGVFCSAQWWGGTWRQASDGSLVPTAESSRTGTLVLPDCPINLSDMRIGFCKDMSSGKIKIRDGSGVRDL